MFVMIMSSREGIRDNKFVTGSVDQLTMELGNKQVPTNLARLQQLRLFIITEIFMVAANNNGNGVSFEMMAPSFKGFDDSEEFAIVDFVILFGLIESTGVKGTRSLDTSFVRL